MAILIAVVFVACAAGIAFLGLAFMNSNDVPIESDAPLLTGNDVESGDLRVEAWISEDEPNHILYRFRNSTSEERSFAWSEMVVRMRGESYDCWGDDSNSRYAAPPGQWKEAYGGCEIPLSLRGFIVLEYDSVIVDTISAP